MLAYYPDLIHLDRAHDEPTSTGHGLEGQGAPGVGGPPPLTGSLKQLPTGYSGDALGATATRGHALVDIAVGKLVSFLGAVKADKDTLRMQKEFYERVEHPVNSTAK